MMIFLSWQHQLTVLKENMITIFLSSDSSKYYHQVVPYVSTYIRQLGPHFLYQLLSIYQVYRGSCFKPSIKNYLRLVHACSSSSRIPKWLLLVVYTCTISTENVCGRYVNDNNAWWLLYVCIVEGHYNICLTVVEN